MATSNCTESQHNLFATVVHIFFEQRNPANRQSLGQKAAINLHRLSSVISSTSFLSLLFSLHKRRGRENWRSKIINNISAFIF
jgi:hypothetical protein